MGAIPPPPPPPRLNLDRFGMPRDYTTYIWLLYKERVIDESPERRAFENGPAEESRYPRFGQQTVMR